MKKRRASQEEERLDAAKPSAAAAAATHGGDLNEGTSQSGALTRRLLQNVAPGAAGHFVQLVAADDCRTVDILHGPTCIAALD